MEQPQGFVIEWFPDHVREFQKTPYGLKQETR